MNEETKTQPADAGRRLSDQLGPLPARWYVLDRDGLATLCKDQDDAQDVAAEAWVQWPQRGPYRVAMLGDVAAERERCKDIVRRHMPAGWSAAYDAMADEGPNVISTNSP